MTAYLFNAVFHLSLKPLHMTVPMSDSLKTSTKKEETKGRLLV